MFIRIKIFLFVYMVGIFLDMSVDGLEIGMFVLVVDWVKNLLNCKMIGK